jgi:hypothetical protein
MNDELEGSFSSLIGVLSWELPGGTEENQESLSQDSRCPAKHLPKLEHYR